MRTGMANLPLHGHVCPRWLFDRMVKLSGAIVETVVEEYGSEEILRRMSDPFWFQALGCVVGFDWHSSGLTTVLCGALKEALRPRQRDLRLYIAGGKAMTSRKTPQEIEEYAAKDHLSINVPELQYASKMAAKVDNSALQDGYQIYHHVFLFTGNGNWAVVQQGMNQNNGWARRYHWLGEGISNFVEEPHASVCGSPGQNVLNMVSTESEESRRVSVLISQEKPDAIIHTLKKLAAVPPQNIPVLQLPAHHHVPNASRIEKTLFRLYDLQPKTYQELLSTEGVGPATVRALALVSEVVHGVAASRREPVRYSFAHGGKDGHPYPVNRQEYDRTIVMLEQALKRSRTGDLEGMKALKRLSELQYRVEKSFTHKALE